MDFVKSMSALALWWRHDHYWSSSCDTLMLLLCLLCYCEAACSSCWSCSHYLLTTYGKSHRSQKSNNKSNDSDDMDKLQRHTSTTYDLWHVCDNHPIPSIRPTYSSEWTNRPKIDLSQPEYLATQLIHDTTFLIGANRIISSWWNHSNPAAVSW